MDNFLLELPLSESNINKDNRKKVYDTIKDIFAKYECKYDVDKNAVHKFINDQTDLFGECDLHILILDNRFKEIAYDINQRIIKYNGYCTIESNGMMTVTVADEIYNIDEVGVTDSHYYHLSKIPNLTELKPSIPTGYMPDNGFEDSKTPRVCFSPSIDKCLMALSANLKGEELYVYIPYNVDKNKFINPKTSQVPDVDITGEVWAIKPIRVKCIGKIKVLDAKDKSHKYKYGDNYMAELYEWEYKIIVNESNEELALPSKDSNDLDIHKLLDSVDPKRIWLTSDWHLFKNHYKHEANYVNTQKIVTWCRQNIRDDDIFMYLGDISFRYANKKDQLESQKIMASIPGIKVLILGNHDRMLGDEYYTACGFKFVFEDLSHDTFVFTHRPINMDLYPNDYINIHGHIHNIRLYNTCDGSKNINVYPMFYDNKPVTLDYITHHIKELTKENKWNPNAMLGESVINGAYYKAKDYDNIDLIQKLNESSIHEQSVTQKATVYFSNTIDAKTINYMAGLFANNLKGNVAIKLHMGEDGNPNMLNPDLIKPLTKWCNGALVDSNVAYESEKATTKGHLLAAKKHGFNFAPIDILDQDGDMILTIPGYNKIQKELDKAKKETNYVSPISPGPHLKEINVGSHLANYDSMIVYTHFKGHIMAGYGGSLKNIGMGIPSGKVGKMQVHGKEFKWGPDFLERLTESAQAIDDYFEGHIIYINVLKNLSTCCDCEKDAPKATMPDIGVVVSDNLLAVEQASIDLIRLSEKNKDLMQRISSRGGMHQLEYLQFLTGWNRDYILRDLNNNYIKLETCIYPNSNKQYQIESQNIDDNKLEFFDETNIFNGYIDPSDIAKYDILIKGTSAVESMNRAANRDALKENFNDNQEAEEFENKRLNQIREHAKENSDKLDSFRYALKYLKDHQPINEACKDIKDARRFVNDVNGIAKKYNANYFVVTDGASGYSDGEDPNEDWSDSISELETVSMTETKRSELPDSAFGIPEDRKFPLDTEQHVRSAIKLFGHADVSKKKSLAQRIRSAAKKYDISIPETTQCYKYLTEEDIEIIPESVENLFLVNTDTGLASINIADIDRWYICIARNPSNIDEAMFCKTLREAIAAYVKDEMFQEAPAVEEYVFSKEDIADDNGFHPLVCLGKILVYENREYEWIIQYPVKYDNGSITSYKEWAMASMNPIIGVSKPFILKIGSDSGSIINTKQYALSPDIISDKYLVVNENANLDIVDRSFLENKPVEIYKFIGNNYYINRIYEAYQNHKIVDNTFFYTALTNKPMLSEDQIDFDESFIKVDLDLLKEQVVTDLASIRDNYLETIGMGARFGRVLEESYASKISFMRKYNKYKDIFIQEDFDGFYFYNSLNNKRTGSVGSTNMLTETMLKTIL